MLVHLYNGKLEDNIQIYWYNHHRNASAVQKTTF